MKIDTIRFAQNSVYNGKVIEDMTDEEKAAIVTRFKERGCTCIIDGYNDEEEA